MEFWNNLSQRFRMVLTAALAVVFLMVGFFFYPTHLKSKTRPSSQDILLPNEPTRISVYVTGAVQRPGVYTLPHGSRVKDLLRIAGPKKEWDPEGINLARRLEDEDMVVVPRITPEGLKSVVADDNAPVLKAKLKTKETVSLNKATLTELQSLPGVGPGMAKRILDYRISHGSFSAVDDLRDVPGLGGKKFEKMKPFLRL